MGFVNIYIATTNNYVYQKTKNGKWLFEKYLEDGWCIRKTFVTKGEAAYENYIKEQAITKH